MYELIKVTEHCYYVNSPAKIGLVRLEGNDVCFIDSGLDKDAAKKAKQHLDANGWNLKMVINTHYHADHTGGNRFLQDRTGCTILCPEAEACMIRNPILEPSFLFGGYPTEEMQHKFLMAQPSEARPIQKEDLPEGFEIIPLPGHSPGMIGIRTPEDIVFLADCLSSPATLEKYKVTFIFNIGQYLNTLEQVKQMQARLFIPSHAEPGSDMTALAQLNIDTVQEIARQILFYCEQPQSFEQILKRVFDDYGIRMTFEQNIMIGSTVRSYLSYLKECGKVEASFEDNIMVWKGKA